MTVTPQELLATLIGSIDEFVGRFVDRMRNEVAAYAQVEAVVLAPATRFAMTVVFDAMTAGRPFYPAELETLADHGEVRGRQGLSLDEVFAGWHVASRMLLDDLVRVGREAGVGDHVLLDLSHDVLRTVDEAMLASARGHHRAEFEIARLQQNHRADLVRGILFGTLAPATIRLQIESYGLAFDRDYYAVRSRPTTTTPTRDLEQALRLAPTSGRPHGLGALVDGDLVGFVDVVPPQALSVAVGLGPAVRADRLEMSFRLATRAMTTAIAFGIDGTRDLRSLGLLPAVVTDTDVGDELVERYLTPLGGGDGAAAIRSTVSAYLAHDMRIDRTAEVLTLHPNSVRYRLTRFETLTGANLRDTGELLEIWWALRRWELRT
ncbi:PucR family transcriptional regulator [Antrihabitans spumae]|uniref:PucR family transcriptional regulator n=1 Tax=Antrihabitans spumae TaxID=3373370 RepID=A0ABW7K1J9_9NOCA